MEPIPDTALQARDAVAGQHMQLVWAHSVLQLFDGHMCGILQHS